GEAGRGEEGARLVDAAVDDRDLHPAAVGPGCGAQGSCADHRRAAVEVELVAEAGVDGLHEAEPYESGQTAGGKRHGEPVEQDPVVPGNARLGDRSAKLPDPPPLTPVQP